MPYKNAEDARKYRVELLAFCKEKRLCTACQSKDAYTMIGRSLCASCASKSATYKREHSDPAKRSAQRKELRLKHIANHECTVCGRRLSDQYLYKTCEYCRAKKRRSWLKKDRVLDRGSLGVCYTCNKNQTIPGKGLCQECYNRQIPIALKALQAIDKNKHPWKGIRYGKTDQKQKTCE